MQRHDVASTLMRRYLNVMPAGYKAYKLNKRIHVRVIISEQLASFGLNIGSVTRFGGAAGQ